MDLNLVILIVEFVLISVELVILIFMIRHIDKLRDYTMRLEKNVEDIDNRIADIDNKVSASQTK